MIEKENGAHQAMKKDSLDEGRKKYEMDVDRMMNEGMAGGNIYAQGNRVNIEEAHEFNEEDPPRQGR
ncbi:conserved hypothetical protein [[Clostridium] ultunense Esp]|nr:conserved hypothetical protein [[Clostridium] ultunense Esp]